MPIYQGGSSAAGIYLGSTPVQAIYVGTTQAYSASTPPTITTISPSSGTAGTDIAINGSNFVAGSTVSIGGVAATNVSVLGTAQIVCKAPTLTTSGTKDVVVSGAGGTATLTGGFTYAVSPTYASISPINGGGGTTVTITGTNFVVGNTTVTFGVTGVTGFPPATNVSVSSSTSLTCKIPEGFGSVTLDVVIKTAGSSVKGTGVFTNYGVPTFASVSPNTGIAGTAVTVTGTNFMVGDTTVTIGGSTVGVTVNSNTSLTCTIPTLLPGTKNIVITTKGGSVTGTFNYLGAPTYTAISPTSAGSGATVTIGGTNFVSGSTTVTIGGVSATNVSVASGTSLTCTVPSLSAGAKDVVITTPVGSVTGGGVFTTLVAPTYSGISSSSGKAGDSISVTGSNFISGTSVTLGGAPVIGLSISSTSSLSFQVPTISSAGAKSLVITNSVGSVTGSNVFTYYAAPTYIGTSATQVTSGTQVTITGSGFVTGQTTVTVGGTSATIFVNSTTSLGLLWPTMTLGWKSMVITTPGGSASIANAAYYNIPTETIYSTAGAYNYTIPTWCSKIDVVMVGGGGAGGQGGAGFNTGGGGKQGSWSGVTISRPAGGWTVTTLSGVVGAGAPAGIAFGAAPSAGGNSTLSSPSTVGTGGAANFYYTVTRNGGSPGNYTFNNRTYSGGAASTTASGNGNAPGGGGSGGDGVLLGGTNSGAGAAGRVWLYAY